ncbi:DUF485 domain-containing protein [Streptomyces sp. NPDC003480]
MTVTGDPLAYVRADAAALRRAHRSLRRSTVGLVLGGHLSYAALSCLAPSLIGARTTGHLTLGMALGLGEMGLVATVLVRHARHTTKRIDPLADRLRSYLAQRRRAATKGATA